MSLPYRCLAQLICAAAACFIAAEAVRAQPDPTLPSPAEVKTLLAERDRFEREAKQLQGQGKLKEALAAAEQTLDRQRKLFSETHDDVAGALRRIGRLHELLGDYPAAKKDFESALAICKKIGGENHPDAAGVLRGLGELLLAQADYAGAKQYFEQALAIQRRALPESQRSMAFTLNGLGLVLSAQGNYAGAKQHFEEALGIFTKAKGADKPDTATALRNLGHLHRAQGDYAGAQKYYGQALSIFQKALPADHPDTAAALGRLGYVLLLQGQYPQAHRFYDQALRIDKKALGENHPGTAMGLADLGMVLRAQRKYAEARKCYEQALQIVGRLLDASSVSQSERQQLATAQQWRRQLDGYLTLASEANLPADEVYARLLPLRGTVFLRQRLQRQLRGSTEPGVAKAFAALEATSQHLTALAFAEPDSDQLPARLKLVEELTRQKEALEAELAEQCVLARHGKALGQLDPAQLQKSLPPDVALVDFLEYTHYTPPTEKNGPWKNPRQLLAFVVRAGRPVVLCELGPVALIAAAIDDWRDRIKQAPSATIEDPSRVVGKLVWAPLQEHLKGAKTVLIVPDGITTRLPFVALPGQAKGKYLIEELTLAEVPVPQLAIEFLAAAPPPATAQGSLLLVGNVDYDAAPDNAAAKAADQAVPRTGLFHQWKPLSGTEGEVLVIRNRFEKRFKNAPLLLLSEGEPTVSAFRQHSGKYRWLHLATHGFFAPKEVRSALAADPKHADEPDNRGGAGISPGLLSGLVLAGANRPAAPGQDNGILTALEAAELDLRACEMAVLSACGTGLGEAAGGEGVLGLQRAFQIAGARTVVASLWSVDDKATRELMERFYASLWDKQKPFGKAEALRQAQLWMLNEGGARGFSFAEEKGSAPADKRPPPYFWAAFVLSGDWR